MIKRSRSDLTGKRFGRLVVIRKTDKRYLGNVVWECLCDCGKTSYVARNRLITGNTKSCGCGERKQHDLSRSRPYVIWAGMKQRCDNKNHGKYKYYGGRDISYDKRWITFEGFWSDMKTGYTDVLTLERVNVNGDYNKENCTWVTRKEQSNNRRNNHLISFDGKTKTLSQWADLIGVSSNTLYYRVCKYGWTLEKALSENTKK